MSIIPDKSLGPNKPLAEKSICQLWPVPTQSPSFPQNLKVSVLGLLSLPGGSYPLPSSQSLPV
jgi:hypothetical protein